jgi:Planctomycete cytochrome C.
MAVTLIAGEKMKKFLYTIVIISNLFAQIDYTTQIHPIFDNSCTGCHVNGGTYSGGLDLSSYAQTMEGGNSGNTIVPLDHSNSVLYNRITLSDTDPQFMPKNDDPLSQYEIDLIAQWIDEGALETPAVDYSGPVWYIATTGSDETGDGSEENPYATIQKGVDIAIDMDTVYVSNGTYEGGIVISNKSISLIGESREETKINQPISSAQISIIECDTDTTRVENFAIESGSSNNGGGISVPAQL